MSECLVLGPEGTGKTLLLRKLQALCTQDFRKARGERKPPNETTDGAGDGRELGEGGVVPTMPTVGTNVQELKLSKRLSCTVREYGGSMAPLWSSAYRDTHMVIYVVDTSRPTQISAATVLLMETLSSDALQGKPFLILFNKIDSAFAMSLVELKSIMKIDDVLEAMPHSQISVVHGSCATGEGLEEVLQWIRENTACKQ